VLDGREWSASSPVYCALTKTAPVPFEKEAEWFPEPVLGGVFEKGKVLLVVLRI